MAEWLVNDGTVIHYVIATYLSFVLALLLVVWPSVLVMEIFFYTHRESPILAEVGFWEFCLLFRLCKIRHQLDPSHYKENHNFAYLS